MVFDPDNPLKEESRRNTVVNKAVEAAERVILSGSKGTVEETDYLTAEVALRYMQKVHNAFASKLLRKELEERNV